MKIPFLIVVCFLLPALVSAQISTVYEHLVLRSEILNTSKKYAVYLPAGYETSQRSYPVLYLLHGAGDDHTGWIQFGEVQAITDQAVREGKSTPMIIVMPDASGENRGYINDSMGEWRYEDYFFEELMPHVEKTYRIRAEKRYRAVAGLSMGGSGTYFYALHRPDLFSSACPLSSSGRFDREINSLNQERAQRNLPAIPLDRFDAWIAHYDVMGMIANMSEENLTAVRWYIDAGDDDVRASEGAAKVHAAMNAKGIPHEFRVRDGAHNWTYWRTALPEVLDFVSKPFAKR
jgi:enterochelin esterase-like enzyme